MERGVGWIYRNSGELFLKKIHYSQENELADRVLSF